MIKTLRESKAKLSELVNLASEGHDILITVRGKAKARLTTVENVRLKGSREAWLQELSKLRKLYGKARILREDVFEDLREDRF